MSEFRKKIQYRCLPQGIFKNWCFIKSSGPLNMADLIKTRHYDHSSNWINLYNSDRIFHRGLMDMASLDSPVTDSAAAASSWGSGERINNGALNMGPDGQQYRPINQFLKMLVREPVL